MMPRRPGAERSVGFQIALDEIVVPAAKGERRNVHALDLPAHTDGLPEGIVGRVIGQLSPHLARLARGGAVGGPQRQMQHEVVEFGSLETGSAQVEAHPEQAVAEFHRAAGGIKAVAIIVVAGHHRRDGF